MMDPEAIKKMNEDLVKQFKDAQDQANKALLTKIEVKLDKQALDNSTLRQDVTMMSQMLDRVAKNKRKM